MNRIFLVTAAFAILFPAQIAFAAPERTSTVADRRSVNLTIYNAGMSLVHDRRRIPLRSGANQIAWRDVSANMDSTSAILESLTSPGKVAVLEQNFDFDLMNPSALLDKYVGHYVTVVHDPEVAGQRETKELAKVLSTNGGIVLQYKNRIETSVRGHIAYPADSKNFRDRPTLVLDLDSTQAGAQTLDLSYITGGLSWRADYIAVMTPDERHMSLTGLVTLSNTSGASYENARLQLVAGNINAAAPWNQNDAYGSLRTIANVTSVPRQESFLEYHLYTMPRLATVLDKQTKQLTLLSAHDIPVQKTLELRSYQQNYYQSAEPDLGDRLQLGVYVSFQNRGGDLGIPLPAGIVRVYKDDSYGLSQFAGSDNIQHTPRNETVRLHLGDSFDVTARKRQTDFQQGICWAQSSYEIIVSNAKTSPQDVLVVESIPGDWQILSENFQHKKSSAHTASWSFTVPADSHTTLDYTAHVTWCRAQ